MNLLGGNFASGFVFVEHTAMPPSRSTAPDRHGSKIQPSISPQVLQTFCPEAIQELEILIMR